MKSNLLAFTSRSISNRRRRRQLDFHALLPTHFPCLVSEVQTCHFQRVVEAEATDEDAGEDDGDGGVAVHGGWSVGICW